MSQYLKLSDERARISSIPYGLRTQAERDRHRVLNKTIASTPRDHAERNKETGEMEWFFDGLRMAVNPYYVASLLWPSMPFMGADSEVYQAWEKAVHEFKDAVREDLIDNGRDPGRVDRVQNSSGWMFLLSVERGGYKTDLVDPGAESFWQRMSRHSREAREEKENTQAD